MEGQLKQKLEGEIAITTLVADKNSEINELSQSLKVSKE